MATKKEDVVVAGFDDETLARFDGETIVKSERYRQYANLLDTLLEPDKAYSHDEIQAILDKELKRPVKVEINQ